MAKMFDKVWLIFVGTLLIVAWSYLSVPVNASALERLSGKANRRRAPDALSLRQCDAPNFQNGLPRMRQRRKYVKFECVKDFVLFGARHAGCVSGKWDSPIPVCAKKGCRKKDTRENGFVSVERQGLVARLVCKESYQVAGSWIAYCDGESWDRELGTCRESTKASQQWCDFETEDLCGWTHDDSHDFEWKRELGSNSLLNSRTGPQHDHTSQVALEGHYMLVEAATYLPGDRARLISPVYDPSQSVDACFQIFYHMYGASVGTLRVFARPMSVDMDAILQDTRYLFFNESGNQRNVWHMAIFELDKYAEPFQLIVEGTTGSGHLSDIAIDDVALMHDNECTNARLITRKPPIEERGGIFDFQSCKDRCDETEPSKMPDFTMNDGGIIKGCDCYDGCDDGETCCPDYQNLCVYGTTQYSSEITEGSTSELETSTEYGTTESSSDIPTVLASSIRFTSTTRPTTTRPTNTRPTSTRPTTTRPTTTRPTTTRPTTTRPTTTRPTTTRPTTTRPTTTRPTTTTLSPTRSTAILRTARPSSARPTATRSTTPPVLRLVTIRPSRTPFISPTRPDASAVLPDASAVLPDASAVTRSVLRATNKQQDDTNHFDWDGDDPAPSPLSIVLISLATVCIAFGIAAVTVLCYRQNCGPENYKKKAVAANRRENLLDQEFCDVHYLTSDEKIAFTLQTPETSVDDEIR